MKRYNIAVQRRKMRFKNNMGLNDNYPTVKKEGKFPVYRVLLAGIATAVSPHALLSH